MNNHQKEHDKILPIERDSYWNLLNLWSQGRTHYHTINGFYLTASTLLFVGLVGLYSLACRWFTVLVALIGVFVCFQWFLATWRQYTQLRYWVYLLREAEEKYTMKRIISQWPDYGELDWLWQSKGRSKDGEQMKWPRELSSFPLSMEMGSLLEVE